MHIYQLKNNTFINSKLHKGLPGFRRKSMVGQLTQVAKLGCMFPIYSTIYMIAPNSKMGKFMKKPFVKFICHSTSYLTFLRKFHIIARAIVYGTRNKTKHLLDYSIAWSGITTHWIFGARIYRYTVVVGYSRWLAQTWAWLDSRPNWMLHHDFHYKCVYNVAPYYDRKKNMPKFYLCHLIIARISYLSSFQA